MYRNQDPLKIASKIIFGISSIITFGVTFEITSRATSGVPSKVTFRGLLLGDAVVREPRVMLSMRYQWRLVARYLRPLKPSTSHLSPVKSSLANMSTFTLPNIKSDVAVHLTPDLSQEQLLSFPAFKTWITTLQHSLSTQQNRFHTFHSAPYELRTIKIQSVGTHTGSPFTLLWTTIRV